MSKFRNIIVHQYEKVDPSIVTGILQNNIDDFRKFSGEIVAYLKSTAPDSESDSKEWFPTQCSGTNP